MDNERGKKTRKECSESQLGMSHLGNEAFQLFSPQHRSEVQSRELVISREEWRQMLIIGGPLDKLILVLGIVGLRASEIAKCQVEWIDWQRKTLRVPDAVAKLKHGRVVPIGFTPVWEVISAFFALQGGVGLTRQSIWRRVKGLARRAGLHHRVTVHALRATGATWAAETGYSVQAIREIFGWSELRTAERYIAASGRTGLSEVEAKGGFV